MNESSEFALFSPTFLGCRHLSIFYIHFEVLLYFVLFPRQDALAVVTELQSQSRCCGAAAWNPVKDKVGPHGTV